MEKHQIVKALIVLTGLLGFVAIFLPFFELGIYYNFTSDSSEWDDSGPSEYCYDLDNPGTEDALGRGCYPYDQGSVNCGDWDDDDFTANELCCACGGGSTGSSRILSEKPIKTNSNLVATMHQPLATVRQQLQQWLHTHPRNRRGLEEVSRGGSIEVKFSALNAGCEIKVYEDGKEVDPDSASGEDVEELEQNCNSTTSAIGIYCLLLVPWAAIAMSFSVLCFWKANKDACACNCDNNKCCPINGLVFAIIHLIAIFIVQGMVHDLLGGLNTEAGDDENGFEAYFRNGAGLNLSFATYIICIILCFVLICLKGQDQAPPAPAADAGVVTAVATSVPVQAEPAQ